jgi:hypothetical protein
MTKVSDFSIMILMVSLVAIAGTYYAADVATAYNVTGPDLSYMNSTAYSSINNMSSTYKTMQQTMSSQNRTGDFINNAWNFIGFMSGAFINTGFLFLGLPGLMTGMMTGISDLIPIPGIVIAIISLAIIVAISIAVYRSVSKSDL